MTLKGQCSGMDMTLLLGSAPWYQDDLPNILGINPLEAAVIFGALYYYYGPTTLYKYTREAGVLFSTYAPVVRDLVTDIASEFKEYLDEDREREDLKKAGVDIDNLPRRTTNIIERFQESLDTFSEMTASLDGGSSAGTRASGESDIGVVDEEVAEGASSVRSRLEREQEEEMATRDGKIMKRKRRKSKREIMLEDGFVDLPHEAEGEAGVDKALEQSVAAVQERFKDMRTQPESNMNVQAAAAAEATAAIASMSETPGTPAAAAMTPQALMAQQMQVQATLVAQQAEAEAEVSKSKFAAQFNANDWNAKVMQQTGANMFEPVHASASPDTFGWPSADSLVDGENGEFGPLMSEELAESQFPLDPEWRSFEEEVVMDIPQDLSASDSPEIPALDLQLDVPAGESSVALEVLKELDRDYLSLRKRVISLIEEQEDGVEVVKGGTKEITVHEEEEEKKY